MLFSYFTLLNHCFTYHIVEICWYNLCFCVYCISNKIPVLFIRLYISKEDSYAKTRNFNESYSFPPRVFEWNIRIRIDCQSKDRWHVSSYQLYGSTPVFRCLLCYFMSCNSCGKFYRIDYERSRDSVGA